jgi:hypothetical protein
MARPVRPHSEDLDNPWDDLVVSILSVNQYSLEKTYPTLPFLREAGLLSPESLGSQTLEQIVVLLKAANCDRGPFMTTLFAVRLASLGSAVSSRGIVECTRILLSNDPDAIRTLLLPIKGIGPKVLQNFFMLRGIK